MGRLSLLFVCLIVGVFSVWPAVAADATLTITPDRPVYGQNDTMTVYLSLANSGPAVDVDLYIAVGILGNYYFYPTFTTAPYPISFTLTQGFDLPPVPILALPLPVYVDPPLTLTWLAAMLEHGTAQLVGDVAQSTCSLYKGCAGAGVAAEDVSENTTWGPGQGPIIVTYGVYVNEGATLTIQPGTVVKMDEATMTVMEGATLICQGTALQPITFTSFYDDGTAGDQDGLAVAPQPGDWGRIEIRGEGVANFDYVRFAYGGYGDGALDYWTAGEGHVRNCTFCKNGDEALYLPDADPSVTIENNLFWGNNWPIGTNGDVLLGQTNTFTGHGLPANTYNGIFINVDNIATANANWVETEVPFVIRDMRLYIGYTETGKKLTIGPGVVVKLESAEIDVQDSSLIAQGTESAPVIFTSFYDDSYLGDTNGDGDTRDPERGDWYELFGFSGTMDLNYAYVLYGGDSDQCIRLDGLHSPRVTNCTIAHCLGYSLDLTYAIDEVIQNNRFADNVAPIYMNCWQSIDDSNTFSIAGMPRNDLEGIYVLGSDYLNVTGVQWLEKDVPIVLEGRVWIGSSDPATLTIGPGVVLKSIGGSLEPWDYGSVTIQGTAANPVIFTSLYDDTVMGDSNGDGSATTPQPSDTGGIAVYGGQISATYLKLYYAYSGVSVSGSYGGTVALSQSEFAHNEYSGFSASAGSGTIGDCTYHDNDPLCDLRFSSDEVYAAYTLTNVTGNVCVD